MPLFGVITENAYEALGVTRDASMEAIRQAYRQLARKFHPDTSSAATDDEKAEYVEQFRKVQAAYEWLCAHHTTASSAHNERERTEDITVGGVNVTLHYSSFANLIMASMTISLENARQIQCFPDGVHILRVGVLVDGRTAFEAEGRLSSLQRALHRYDKQQQVKPLWEQLERWRSTAERYEYEGRPTTKLMSLITTAAGLLDRYENWSTGSTIPGIQSALTAVERELERVENNSTELIISGLMDGSIYQFDIAHNNAVVAKVMDLSIRSGGFIEPITEEVLRAHYKQRLGDIVTLHESIYRDLRISLEDYAPADILAELENEKMLAPTTVELQNGNRSNEYAIRYEIMKIDKVPTKVGIVTIPLTVYRKNAFEYGKASKFPELPYDIQLKLEIVQQNRVIAVGSDNEALLQKVKKFTGGVERGKKLKGTAAKEGISYLTGPLQASVPPPWFKGRAR